MCLKDNNLYYIGGVVRDSILGIKNFDVDLCYQGNAIDYAQENKLEILKTNPDFGTVKVLYEDKEIDIASTRCETYPKKGHLPKVNKIGCTLKEDVIRRDFTINCIAKRTTDEEIIDYFNGVDDINNHVLRVLHDNSFIDDPTRIIRGLKFSVRFNFELDEHTQNLQAKYLDNINYDISYHRLKKELKETFSLNIPSAFDIFNNKKIYKLLGNNLQKKGINGLDIKNEVTNYDGDFLWLIYMSPFVDDKTLLPLTKSEKRILEWSKRLLNQSPSNNTPEESLIIRRILDKIKQD